MTVVSAPLHAAAQGFSLSLVASHSVVLSGGSHPVNFRVPENIDILSSSDITFALSGSFNRVQVASEMLLRSALVRRLQCHLMMARSSFLFAVTFVDISSTLRSFV
jgi:hypothetical protein